MNQTILKKRLTNCLMKLPLAERKATIQRLKWLGKARDSQLPPKKKHDVWLVMSGRGWGKTRTAVEEVWWHCYNNPGTRFGVICATKDDVRKTAFDGESGFFSVIPPEIVLNENKQLHQIEFINGSKIEGFSAEEPRRLRGPQFHAAWCDELAAWQYQEAWDMVEFCVRLGDKTRIIVTTTPRPIEIVKRLVNDPRTIVTRGSTFENKDNLSPIMIKRMLERYEGTRLGRQELHGEIIEDVEGALWTHQMIQDCHRDIENDGSIRTVVGIDPAVTSKETSDETGIIVASKIAQSRFIIHDDLSGRYTPDGWAEKAIWAYDKYSADAIIPEVNNGGDLVIDIIRKKRPNIKIKPVRATKGKYVRAEPISALYEQGKVFHIKKFERLEGQMTSYVPGITTSPDRMDALVWALTDLSGIIKEFSYGIV